MSDQQDECPKAFYCLPESCGDCPHDEQLPCEGCPDPGMPCLGCPEQDEQAMMTYCDTCNQQTVESVSSRRYSHEDMHDAEQRAFMAGHAEGDRAATERIVAMLKESSNETRELWAAKRESAAVSERWASEYWRGQMNGYDHIITELEADDIERGEHEQR